MTLTKIVDLDGGPVSEELEPEPRVVDSGPIVLIAESGTAPPPTADESDGN